MLIGHARIGAWIVRLPRRRILSIDRSHSLQYGPTPGSSRFNRWSGRLCSLLWSGRLYYAQAP